MNAFALPHTLTLDEAAGVLAQARAAGGAIDAAALEVFDSSVLAVLLELRRTLPAGNWRLDNPPQKLCQLAQLYGVHELLGLTAPSA